MNEVCAIKNYSKSYSGKITFSQDELKNVNSLDDLKLVIEEKLKSLQDVGDFSLSYYNSKNPSNYDRSIALLADTIDERLNQENLSFYDSKNIKDFIIGKYSRPLTDNERIIQQVLPAVDITPMDQIDEISYSNEVDKIFGTTYAANDQRLNIFNNQMRTLLIIDTINEEIIDNFDKMNNSIISYLDEQFSRLKQFLKGKGFNTDNISMFINNQYGVKEINNSYIDILQMMYHYLESESNYLQDKVTQSWMNNGTINGDRGALFHAVNAYLNIMYFDEMVKENLGDYISVNKRLGSPIVFQEQLGKITTQYKYTINTKDKFKGKNNWDDAIQDGIASVGKFQKVLISSIPIRNYLNPNEIYRNMEAKDFLGSITLLMDAATRISKTDLRENFINSALNHRNNMQESLKYMLEFMFNGSTEANSLLTELKNKGLDVNTFNNLFSIYTTLFSGINDQASWYEIEQDYILENGYDLNRVPIIDTLLGFADSNVLMSYLQTTYNTDEQKIETKVKNRFSSDKNKFDLIHAINNEVLDRDDKASLLKTYQINQIPESTTYQIKLGNLEFTVSPSSVNILKKKDYLIFSENITKLLDNLPDLTTKANKERLAYRQDLTNAETNFMSILQFIDTMLTTDFSLSVDGLTKLQFLQSLNSNNIKGLLSSAIRALVITDVYNEFNNAVIPNTQSKYIANELTKFLKDYPNVFPSKAILDLQGYERNEYFTTNVEGEHLIVVKSGDKWIDDLAKVNAILSGNSSVSVIANLSGDKIPIVSQSYLGAKIWQELSKSKSAKDSTSPLLFVNKPGTILRQVVNTDVETENGNKKSVRDASLPELLHDSIINKFIIPWSDNQAVYIQPTVYSDKTKFVQYLVQLGSDLGVNITSSEDTIISQMINTVGAAYINVWNRVKEDYKKIFPEFIENGDLNLNKLQEWLKSHSEQDLVDRAVKANVVVYRDTHFRNFNKQGLALNELLYEFANNLYNNPELLKKRLQKDKQEFIKILYQNRFNLKVKYNSDRKLDLFDPITKFFNTIEQKNQKDWIIGDRLILAKARNVNNGHIRNIIAGEIHDNEEIILNPVLNSYFLLDNLIGNNLRLSLTGSEINHKVKSLSNFNGIKISTNEGDISIESGIYTNFLSKFSPTYKNDAITFYDVDQAIKNARISGSLTEQEIKALNDLEKVYQQRIYATENAAQNAQFKRNVIIPGTMRYYLQNTLYGIRDKMNVAIIDDLDASVFNFDGNIDKVDAHDGSALINPLTSLLENWSLQDSAVGTIKKPIHHWYDDRYMTATLFKYAVDTITNKWMRQSEGNSNGIRLRNIFQKMTNKQWAEPIDLFRCDYKEGDFSFLYDILKGNKLFYREDGLHKQIVDFGVENGVYYTEERIVNSYGTYNSNSKNAQLVKYYHYFSNSGEHYKIQQGEQIDTTNLHSINSLFELHTALGGIYSESLNEDGKLDYSEASNIAVANWMNYVSVKKDNAVNDELTQLNYRQPLKEYMIDMLANNSSIKNGAGNVNPNTRFSNDENFNYITVGTQNYGIQMDADHEADEGQMTEFSQVISSLDAGGRLHEYVSEIYETLGQIALDLSNVELTAMKDYNTTGNKTALYITIGKTIMNNFSKNKSAGLAEAIFNAVKEEFNLNSDQNLANDFLPFSDPNIYSTILSTFVSTINKKSIKRKYPGQGTVMVPAYNLSMIYDVNGSKYQYEDVLKIALESAKASGYVSQFKDVSLKNRDVVNWYLNQIQEQQNEITIDQIEPTDNIIAYVETFTPSLEDPSIEEIAIHEVPISLNKIEHYYSFIDNPILFLNGKGYINIKSVKYKKNVKAPRNLAPAKISWDVQGQHMNIFTHWRVKKLFLGLNYIKNHNIEEINQNFGYEFEDKDQAEKQLRKDCNVQQAFDELDKGLYVDESGNQFNITNLQSKAAEMITSNLFKTRFGIKSGDSLVDVRMGGEKYFKTDYKKIDSNYYDLSFTSRDDNDLCISFKPLPLKNSTLTYKKQTWENTILVPVKQNNGNVIDSIVYTTKDNVPLFEVGRRILRENVEYRNGVFVDRDTKEILPDQNRFQRYKDNQVVEKIFYVNKYNVRENKKTYQLFTISDNKLLEVFSKSNPDDTEQQYINDKRNYIGKLLSKIYNYRDFSGINVNSKLSVSSKKIMSGALRSLSYNLRYDQNLSTYVSELVNILDAGKLSVDKKEISLSNINIRKIFGQYQDLVARERYVSFLKSQYFTVSRIPAQTLQSFMQMENVGYTGVDNNQCFVSHWQNLPSI